MCKKAKINEKESDIVPIDEPRQVIHVDFKNKRITRVEKTDENGTNQEYTEKDIRKDEELALLRENIIFKKLFEVPEDKRDLIWAEKVIDILAHTSDSNKVKHGEALLKILEENLLSFQNIEKRGVTPKNNELYRRLQYDTKRLRFILKIKM